MPYSVTVRTRFEAGHRLPHLPGKCINLHGHSWVAHTTLTAPTLTAEDMVLDFTRIKAHLQQWADTHFDHGMILGATDPLAPLLASEGVKVYTVGVDPHSAGLHWPTVESVAHILADVARTHMTTLDCAAQVSRVTVSETENNSATWQATP